MITTEAAISLSNLIEEYRKTYNFSHVFLIIAHATLTAGMQHLYDLSKPPPVAAQASLYLRDAIRALQGMAASVPVSTLYLQVLTDLIGAYAPSPPVHARQALEAARLTNNLFSHDSRSSSTLEVSGHGTVPHFQTQGISGLSPQNQVSTYTSSFAPYSTSFQDNSSMLPVDGRTLGMNLYNTLSSASSVISGDLAQLHQGVLALGSAGEDVNVDIDVETWRPRSPRHTWP